MTHAFLISVVLLNGNPSGQAAVEGFPREACDFVVECNDAGSLVEAFGSEALVEKATTLLLGGDFAEVGDGELLPIFLDNGILGGRVDEETGDVEWIGWAALPPDAANALLGPIASRAASRSTGRSRTGHCSDQNRSGHPRQFRTTRSVARGSVALDAAIQCQ